MKQDEPALFVDWQRSGSLGFPRKSWLLSLLFHVCLLSALMLMPRSVIQTPRLLTEVRRPTPLVAPPMELTQTAPNRGKIGREFDLESLIPRPRVQIPPSPPSTTRPAAPLPAPIPKVAPAPIPDPPSVRAELQTPQLPALGADAPKLLPLQIQPDEKPKLVFEKPGGARGGPEGAIASSRVPRPNSSVDEAVRSVMRGNTRGGLVVGDSGEGIGGLGEALNLPPSPGKTASSLELLSDPMGVDFRPYLIRVLAAVRRNWVAVIPESARLGQQSGRVSIQFALNKGGGVVKLVIASPSGVTSLDRAAVAGVSASNPFPPLPAQYGGDQLRLQLTFLYNIR